MSNLTMGSTRSAPVRREQNLNHTSTLTQPLAEISGTNINRCDGVVVTKLVTKLTQQWQIRLSQECSAQNVITQASIVQWLLGEDLDRFDQFLPVQLEIAHHGIEYRYRILSQRYLGVSPTRAYKNLMQRLGGLAILRAQVQAWVTSSRDRHRTVIDVLQEVVQEMIHRDKYIQQQIAWIGECTSNCHLRSTLLLAAIEEYCLRPIRQKPLISHRFINYLRVNQRGGVTNLPPDNFVKIVSDVVADKDGETSTNLIDYLLLAEDRSQQDWEETQILRTQVTEQMSIHLAAKLGTDASQWLHLYLLGKTPEEIATCLQLDLKQIYRLREKVAYHAQVLAIKSQPEIVAEWLKTSLQEYHLGLTMEQWKSFQQNLTPRQLDILTRLQSGTSLATISKDLNLKINQVQGVWKQLYLIAQNLRCQISSNG
jgi:hypothetical protein